MSVGSYLPKAVNGRYFSRLQRLFSDYKMETKDQPMTQRTFDAARAWPPMKPDTLRLYSMRFCPYAQRARLVLAHKKIPHETVNVHLKRKPTWLLERNPKGRVPVLEHPDGRIVFESLIVSQYLEEIYPQYPLTPTDPYRKARDKLLLDYCDKFMMATYQMLFSEGASVEARVTYDKGFRFYNTQLQKRLPDGPFFGGSQPAMVDYMIWPWLERLPMSDDQDLKPSTSTAHSAMTGPVCVTAGRYPYLYKWMSTMFSLPAVKETMFDLGAHRRFGVSQITADPEYDVGLENEPPLPVSAKI